MQYDEMIQGKIYFISYGKNTQLVVRFKSNECTQIEFYDSLHYWNGSATFYKTGNRANYCVHVGIEELREATLPEKHALIDKELEFGCI